jgi:hypothetical protein
MRTSNQAAHSPAALPGGGSRGGDLARASAGTPAWRASSALGCEASFSEARAKARRLRVARGEHVEVRLGASGIIRIGPAAFMARELLTRGHHALRHRGSQ